MTRFDNGIPHRDTSKVMTKLLEVKKAFDEHNVPKGERVIYTTAESLSEALGIPLEEVKLVLGDGVSTTIKEVTNVC